VEREINDDPTPKKFNFEKEAEVKKVSNQG
jgi:hypothetical protein